MPVALAHVQRAYVPPRIRRDGERLAADPAHRAPRAEVDEVL